MPHQYTIVYIIFRKVSCKGRTDPKGNCQKQRVSRDSNDRAKNVSQQQYVVVKTIATTTYSIGREFTVSFGGVNKTAIFA